MPEIRKTTKQDLEQVMEIYAYARKFMAEHGNGGQWGQTNPPREQIEEDIRRGCSYVCTEKGKLLGVFAFMQEPDPTYRMIENGSWLNEEAYGVVHRLASAENGRGAATFCLNWCFARCGNLRVDTHEKNYPMQRLLQKLDFVPCGTIYVRDGSPRIAYQKVGSLRKNWNPAQRLAIESTEGAVMVLSCAGSGKTSVILERTRRIVEKGVRPGRILVATFSKAAAGEMEKRYREEYGGGGVRFATIHSVCYSVLAGSWGLTAESILREQERRSFFREEHGLALQQGQAVSADFEEYYSGISADISRLSLEAAAGVEGSSGVTGKNMGNKKQDAYAQQIRQRYEQFKRKHEKVDFDDMIILCHQCLTGQPEVLEYWQGVFDYFMLDEYQDTSVLQAEIFFLLAERQGNICIVGDDDQSIYGFRGADSGIFRYFQKCFPKCQVIMLEKNYRSLPGILKCAQRVIVHNRERFPKKLQAHREGKAEIQIWNGTGDREQVAAVLKQIEKSVEAGREYRDIAVLYRVKKEAATLVNRLLLEDIPFYIREMPEDIHKGLVYRDVMAYYRLSQGMEEPGDLQQIINRPKRYIKNNLIRNCRLNRNELYLACTRDVSAPYEYDRINDTVNQLFLDLRNLKELKPTEFLGYLKYEMKYMDSLMEYARYRELDEEEMERDYAALLGEAARFSTMEEWQAYVEEIRRGSCLNPDGVYLSTFHGAKGLEWKEVIIISANEKVTPYHQGGRCGDLEEERRLFYVAMTRARDKLSIFSKGKSGEISRFVRELKGV